ncbi:Y-family DNA polymerase [Bacillus cereus]|nr:hypothetical protein [Bacillus bombysepticus]
MDISTARRLYKINKDSNIIIVNATMRRFVEISNQITEIYTKCVALEDLHVYSIDVCSLDIQQTAHLFGHDPIVIAKRIQKEVYDITGITASIGIAPNLFLPKVALDVESEHSNSRIAMWSYEDVSKKLWEIKPLRKVWGSKRENDGKVLAIKMIFLNIETKELECEIDLMIDKTFECINHRNRAPFN